MATFWEIAAYLVSHFSKLYSFYEKSRALVCCLSFIFVFERKHACEIFFLVSGRFAQDYLTKIGFARESFRP